MHRIAMIAAIGAMLVGGCDEGEQAAETSGGTEGTAAGEQATAEGTAADEQAAEPAEPAGPCPDATALTLNGVDGVSLSPPTTQFADVTLNRSASFVFTSYTLEPDPQFGLSAPVGDPHAPEGGLIFSINVDSPETLANGTYTEDGENAPGRVSFTSMYKGSDRILPLGDHTVNITEIGEDHICGEIVPAEGATHPTVSGRFKVDKV